ncbi:MAG: hypothetical protein ACHQVK_02670 [Candidatus Paceibacterales bacterium]
MKLLITKNANYIAKTLIALFLLLTLTKVNAQTGNPKYNLPLADSLLMGHLHNIKHLTEIGKLIVAGPMKKNDKEYEGIFTLNVRII